MIAVVTLPVTCRVINASWSACRSIAFAPALCLRTIRWPGKRQMIDCGETGQTGYGTIIHSTEE